MKVTFALLLITLLQCYSIIGQTTYFEDFNNEGYPSNLPSGSYWNYYNEIYPDQDTWSEFIPGDGNAYLIVDADESNDTDLTHPYQTLIFGGVGENHRLEVRMKGAAVNGGLVAFLFTYHQEGSIFNEVDIEVVANDRDVLPHETLPPNGWTDARFNTWRNANELTALPHSGSAKAVVKSGNEKVSLIDNEFHTYTIDWKSDKVDFYIDEVLQDSFDSNVATGWAEIIIGYRALPWADKFNWTGKHTLVIDYLKIEPLGTLSASSENIYKKSSIKLFPNPTNDEVNISAYHSSNIQKMELFNVLSTSLLQVNGFTNKINMSDFPKGFYLLKIEYDNGYIVTKKLVKN
jgi:hypothetical protein